MKNGIIAYVVLTKQQMEELYIFRFKMERFQFVPLGMLLKIKFKKQLWQKENMDNEKLSKNMRLKLILLV